MTDIAVMRATDRFVSAEPGVISRHSFSFGRHYDPGNVGFGLLLMNNDDVVRPGAGYPTHPHRDIEIVTWVLDGALAHQDSTGAGGIVRPGLVQRLSAGRGVRHAEFNAAADDSGDSELRFVQMWIPPHEWGAEPRYEHADVEAELTGGGLVTVASGMSRHAGDAAVGLGQPAAAMHVARLARGHASSRDSAAVTLPGAPFVHVYVARGAINVESVGALSEGDAVRLTDEGGRRVTPTAAETEILVWEMHASAWSPTSV